MKRKNTSHAVPAQTAIIQTLVISQDQDVRQQLVAYLSRSSVLAVSGQAFTPDAIVRAHPDVVILDLSRLGLAELSSAIAATQCVGARLVALASMREPAEEQMIRSAGGLYRLKSAGADGLADTIQEVATPPVLPAVACAAPGLGSDASMNDRRP
jgi:DNA-binding NarL/FixJ family response regulator